MATANQVLDIARSQLGYCRWDDPLSGSKFGRWYGDLVGDSYYGSSGVPYCAMFVTWCLYQAGQGAPGIPGAYCPWILTAGKNAGRTVSTPSAQPGDLVLFDWGGDGVADHIGFVESNNGSYLTCLEGNTTGADGRSGSVARRTRAYSTVIGIIRPEWFEPVPAKPHNVKTADYANDPFQLWYIRGEIEDGAEVSIRNVGTWEWLSDPNSSIKAGTKAQCWDGLNDNLDPKDAQKVILHANGEGWTIAPKVAPHLRLDIEGSNTSPGTNVQFWEANGTPAQDFHFASYDGKYRIIPAAGAKPLNVVV